jgi:Xaa-Pro aminopeptidase
MRFRRNNDDNDNANHAEITVFHGDTADEALRAAMEAVRDDEVDLSSDPFSEETVASLEAAIAEAELEAVMEKARAVAGVDELPIVSIVESIVVGVTNGYYQLSEPTGRSLSLFMDGNKAVLTVYDAEGDYRHIRLDSSHRQMLQSWLDQAAS